MHDFYTDIDADSFEVTASIAIGGAKAGTNLSDKFAAKTNGVYEWKPSQPIKTLPEAKLVVTVKDREGNETRIERIFSVGRQ